MAIVAEFCGKDNGMVMMLMVVVMVVAAAVVTRVGARKIEIHYEILKAKRSFILI